jgi:hypothetical protein
MMNRRHDTVADSIEQGTVRDTQGGKEVWDGEKWLSPLEAVEEYGCSFEEVGELVREEIMGGGGAGPGEYTVSWRIWQVGDKFVLDMTEDGLDYQVCDDLADCEATWHDEAEKSGIHPVTEGVKTRHRGGHRRRS